MSGARGSRGPQGLPALWFNFHHRLTCPQRSSPTSTVLPAAALQYPPINDSSFMKEEQPDGNFCCIESARENACQVSGLLSLEPWILLTLRMRHSVGKRTESPGLLESSPASHVSSHPQLFYDSNFPKDRNS